MCCGLLLTLFQSERIRDFLGSNEQHDLGHDLSGARVMVGEERNKCPPCWSERGCDPSSSLTWQKGRRGSSLAQEAGSFGRLRSMAEAS